MQKMTLISVVAVVVLAVVGFAGGAVTYAELSDTETTEVSVAAGMWTTTETATQTTETVGVESIEDPPTEVDANSSAVTPSTTTETPITETIQIKTPVPTEASVNVTHPLKNVMSGNETTTESDFIVAIARANTS